MLITFLDYHVMNSQTYGIVRSVASIVSGPITGLLAKWLGNRPAIQIVCEIVATLSFIGVMWPKSIPLWVTCWLIGWCDGAAGALCKSLFCYVVRPTQMNMAYAISGVTLNIFSFVFPPIAGALTFINTPTDASGMMWFYAMVLGLGVVGNAFVIVRD